MTFNEIMTVAAVMVAVCGCGANPKDETAQRDPVPVKAQEIPATDNGSTVTYIGTVKPEKSKVLTAAHSGTITGLNVKQGSYVRKGQTVAEIESQSLTSSQDMAHATLKQAEDGYERAKKVYEGGGITEAKWVEVETQLAQARAAAEIADKAVEDCVIKAPYNGYITEVSVSEGEEASIAQPIATIIDINSLEFEFSVPEMDLDGLKAGQDVEISVSALGEDAVQGRIKSKGFTASPLSHSYKCTAVALKPVSGLMPGMACKIRTEKEAVAGIAIPTSIVQTGSEGNYIWVIEDGKAAKRNIVTGGYTGSGVIVTEGLEPGDQVIIEGFQKVSTGMAVKTDIQK